MILLSKYKYYEQLWDPFCASGTIPIEAALYIQNLAPGARRSFASEKWGSIDPAIWEQYRVESFEEARPMGEVIFASDIDEAALEVAKENAKHAGVEKAIRFIREDATKADYKQLHKGLLIMNPPYGDRLLDIDEAREISKAIGSLMMCNKEARKYILTSDADFELYFGHKAAKKRKLYNGMKRCDLYMYY